MTRGRGLRADERAISTLVGALILLAILGMAIVAVNAFHVPNQGAAIEVAARERAESALLELGADVTDERGAPFVAEVPLRAQSPPPPLLAGVILSPAIVEGRVSFDPVGSRITLSHVTDAPSGGAPVGDPMRVDLGDGTMRVYTLGNASAGQPVGALSLAVGGAYLEPASHRLEVGHVLLTRDNASAAVGAGGLAVARGGTADAPTTALSWRLPLLVGAPGEASGGASARVLLSPGPTVHLGGGQLVHNVTIHVETDAVSAWESLLRAAIGSRGTVVSSVASGDAGTVTATILPPAGAPAGVPRVELDLSATRYEVSVTGRG